ncbi:hypothetical protein OKW30_004348 [Paraburkholderia sp. Clong3]|uniref:Uncharacterized protein n=1 Tax=Paraburkholderia tuberum TaxID=157910 RepID=A0A1H1BSR5_9BURK|nr:hypothetical protein [Paraburkholderia sp. Cpub6]MBB5466154.1 hypothetical protein [Paraburkholderia sp. CI2]MDH6150231.1 hypothetical protein [Paraburkholderia sp. WSM4179]SDQ54957.1 hypothetical protein SAMN05445850_0961 [Paraburkholderia tuberum]
MELKRIRHWLFLLMLVRSGRYFSRTREELTQTHR